MLGRSSMGPGTRTAGGPWSSSPTEPTRRKARARSLPGSGGDGVAAAPLRLVQAVVGGAEQVVGGHAGGEGGHADADGHPYAGQDVGAGHRCPDAFGDLAP